jgi:starch synthase
MKKKALSVAMVTTEVVPFSKVGGLADVMGILPDELEKIGCGVSIFTPLYASIDRNRFRIRPERNLKDLHVTIAGRPVPFNIFTAVKPDTGVTVYFIDNEHFYSREGIYTEHATGAAFDDEDERTIFFNRAVIGGIKALDLKPDVIHCNDFHSGLIPALLQIEESGAVSFRETGTVFSVHNLAYQGIYERGFVEKAGIDPSLFSTGSPFEFWGKVNVMKVGISYADFISTVSKTYAKEITTTEEYGYGLEGILRSRKDDVVGILNGIDMEAWNPSTDQLIPATYSAFDLFGKATCRAELLNACGLPESGVPVIGIVSRLVDQKGFDILAEAFEEIMKINVVIVILGTGQQEYHDLYTVLAEKYPEKLGVKLEFNNELAHLIEAGSDFFLMPSRYEPCGLNQLYSLRYGTIPIVRATGGLKDTIKNANKSGTRGNGFLFTDYTPGALAKAIKKAVEFFSDKAAVETMRKRIMTEDHSWQRSAKEYLKLYKRAKRRAGMGLTKG